MHFLGQKNAELCLWINRCWLSLCSTMNLFHLWSTQFTLTYKLSSPSPIYSCSLVVSNWFWVYCLKIWSWWFHSFGHWLSFDLPKQLWFVSFVASYCLPVCDVVSYCCSMAACRFSASRLSAVDVSGGKFTLSLWISLRASLSLWRMRRWSGVSPTLHQPPFAPETCLFGLFEVNRKRWG